MRDEEIRFKAQELQQSLEEWAREKSILQIGERLVFSLRVEHTPIVIQETGEEDYWKMSPGNFFSHQRLVACGATRKLASQVCFAISYICDQNNNPKNMDKFLKLVENTPKVITRCTNIGVRSLLLIHKCLQSANLPIPPGAEKLTGRPMRIQ